MSRNRQLREEYANTWRELSRELSRLQLLTAAEIRDYAAIEAALTDVKVARVRHNEVRDRLACALAGSGMKVKVRYAAASINSMGAPAKTTPSLMTRA
jgi:hypothetical protein